MKTIDAGEIASKVATAHGLSREAAQTFMNAAVEAMRAELLLGNRVVLPELLVGIESGLIQVKLQTPAAGHVVAVHAKPVSAAQPAAPRIQNKILFVVPMQDMFANIIAQRLGEGKSAVVTVEGGDKARALMGQARPGLVLIDGNIGDYESLIAFIKVESGLGMNSVVTVYPEDADPNQVDGLKVCDDEIMQEPYEMDDLVEIVGREMSRVMEEASFFEKEVHFQFRTSEEYVEQANDLMSRLVETSGIEEDKAASLSVAFREAVDNAARHGNKNQETRIIDVIFLLDRQKVTVTVEDEGDGFDTELYLTRGIQGNAVAAARERNQAGRVGGLGIMLMLKCLDDLEYNNVGNLIKLTKYR